MFLAPFLNGSWPLTLLLFLTISTCSCGYSPWCGSTFSIILFSTRVSPLVFGHCSKWFQPLLPYKQSWLRSFVSSRITSPLLVKGSEVPKSINFGRRRLIPSICYSMLWNPLKPFREQLENNFLHQSQHLVSSCGIIPEFAWKIHWFLEIVIICIHSMSSVGFG